MLKNFLKLFLRDRERQSMRRRGAERERERERERETDRQTESQAGSMLSMKSPIGAWTHELQDHDLSWNQELDTQLTEPPRHPQRWLFSEQHPCSGTSMEQRYLGLIAQHTETPCAAFSFSVTCCQKQQSSLLFINVIGNHIWLFFPICLIKW